MSDINASSYDLFAAFANVCPRCARPLDRGMRCVVCDPIAAPDPVARHQTRVRLIVGTHRVLTRDEAVLLSRATPSWWVAIDAREALLWQLAQETLCMPFGEMQRLAERVLLRTVWRHEFIDKARLADEVAGLHQTPSEAEALAHRTPVAAGLVWQDERIGLPWPRLVEGDLWLRAAVRSKREGRFGGRDKRT